MSQSKRRDITCEAPTIEGLERMRRSGRKKSRCLPMVPKKNKGKSVKDCDMYSEFKLPSHLTATMIDNSTNVSTSKAQKLWRLKSRTEVIRLVYYRAQGFSKA